MQIKKIVVEKFAKTGECIKWETEIEAHENPEEITKGIINRLSDCVDSLPVVSK